MAQKSIQTTTSAQMSRIYFVSLAVNTLVLMFANKLSPNSIVFGTSTLSATWALFLSMGALSLINTLCVPIFDYLQKEKQRELSPKEWMLGYFFINFVGLWVITRFSEQFGFGISAWWVGAVIALVLDFVQGLAITKFVYGQSK